MHSNSPASQQLYTTQSHLIERERYSWILLTGHHDYSIPSGHCWGHQRHKGQQGSLIRAGHSHDPHWLVHPQHCAIELGLLYTASILITQCCPVEEPDHRSIHLPTSLLHILACHCHQVVHKLLSALLQVLCPVEKDLGTVKSSPFVPAWLSLASCLHCIPHILPDKYILLTN
ncbi:hypothetical protein E2C01_073035 [Portunus trituberculatus]|uniref:Uncharacterized protein n=1 Tax=Portunus trituberculatus TaxID=210409 RepID=A0A5B7IAK9_PORTR|nr:hypothetical protein [Portunus trituberculatus]